MFDDKLVFEHKLREHVQQVRARIEKFVEDASGSSYVNVAITYDGDDGGKWRIYQYSNKTSVDVKGAELAQAESAFYTTYRALNSARTLRAMIAAPAQSQDTDGETPL